MSHLTKLQQLRHKAKHSFEQMFDIRIFGDYQKTHGILFFEDARKYDDTFDIIFDVGANIGKSTYLFREACPKARIHCFEPVEEIYQKLEVNVRHPLTECHRIALGDEQVESTIYTTYNPLTSSMFVTDETTGSQPVQIVTLDQFAEQKEIRQIDLLKIDTEGYDLRVLMGAEGMLKSGRINYIMVETGFQKENRKHVQFNHFQEWFAEFGYTCFGIYDQETERFGEKRLRLANAVFCKK